MTGTETENRLARDYEHLAFKVVRKSYHAPLTQTNRDEIASEANIALAKAIKGYDEAKTQNFATRVTCYAKWRARDARRRSKQERKSFQAAVDCFTLSWNPGMLVVDEDVTEQRDVFEFLISALTPTEKDLLRLVFVDGLSPTAAAARMGFCKSYVHGIYHRAIDHLKSTLTTPSPEGA